MLAGSEFEEAIRLRTRSKAVEQALGWVAQKMGFCDCIVMYVCNQR